MSSKRFLSLTITCLICGILAISCVGFHPKADLVIHNGTIYTLDAAYGGFEEDIKGSIETGKLADFTVFSQDLMQVPEDRILKTQVAYTIINGEIVYQREKD